MFSLVLLFLSEDKKPDTSLVNEMECIKLTDIPSRETPLPAMIKEFQSRGMSKDYIDSVLITMHNQGHIVLGTRKIVGRTLNEMATIAIVAGNKVFTTVQRRL